MTQSGNDGKMKRMQKTILICIGSTKCGTTWLHSQLSQHDNVHMPPGKEIHYWEWVRAPRIPDLSISNRLAQLALPGVRGFLMVVSIFSKKMKLKFQRLKKFESMLKSSHSDDHSEYLAYLFEHSGNATVVCDFTPNYVLLSKQTFSEALSVHPSVKFLLIMRDPVERLWSSVKFENRKAVARGECTVEFLHKRFCEATLDPFDFLHRKSKYERTIQELEAAVPAELIHYMFYEDIFFRRKYKELFEFLEIGEISMDTGSSVNIGNKRLSRPPQEQWKLAIDRFSETYKFIDAKFGDCVPQEWNS